MNVTLSCTLACEPGSLVLTYAVANAEAHDVGIFNWVEWHRPDGTVAFPRDSAYVELAGSELLVRKRALPVPEGLRMAAYVPPPASLIRAGERFEERIVLPRPLVVLQPFRAALLRGQVAGEVVADKPAEARSLRLEVGVFPLDLIRLTSNHPAHPQVLGAFPPGQALAQQQILSFDASLAEPLDVLDYRGVPWP